MDPDFRDNYLPGHLLTSWSGGNRTAGGLGSVRVSHMPMALSTATLYAEELKATMRGRFAWLGPAVILLAVGGLATVGTQDT
jgi:hypothetical protein